MPFAIGIEGGRTAANLGTLMRSAVEFGASAVFTVGRRYQRDPSDTVGAAHQIPIMHFEDWQSLKGAWPIDWVPVGVELSPGAESIVNFTHPRRAIYLLGPEDGALSIPTRVQIVIPTRRCINVAVAGSIVMYDRAMKEIRAGRAAATVPTPLGRDTLAEARR
jgi:tRNA (guanosine-2'-O-)-methyltransferase